MRTLTLEELSHKSKSKKYMYLVKHISNFNKKIKKLETDYRILERDVKKCELREKQILLVFKKLLDVSCKRKNPPRIDEIADFMATFVWDRLNELEENKRQ